MAMATLVLTDHGAGGHVQRGEQARRAVPHVVVGLPLGYGRHHRQHGAQDAPYYKCASDA